MACRVYVTCASPVSRFIDAFDMTVLLNVPICIVALALVLVALRRVNFQERRGYLTWAALYRDVKSSFDFIGMVLLMGSTACVLLGFSRTASVGCEFHETLYSA